MIEGDFYCKGKVSILISVVKRIFSWIFNYQKEKWKKKKNSLIERDFYCKGKVSILISIVKRIFFMNFNYQKEKWKKISIIQRETMMWNEFLTIWPDRSWIFNMLQPALKKGINTAKIARGNVALVIAIGVMLNVAFSYQFFWRWLTIRSTIRSVIASVFYGKI